MNDRAGLFNTVAWRQTVSITDVSVNCTWVSTNQRYVAGSAGDVQANSVTTVASGYTIVLATDCVASDTDDWSRDIKSRTNSFDGNSVVLVVLNQVSFVHTTDLQSKV